MGFGRIAAKSAFILINFLFIGCNDKNVASSGLNPKIVQGLPVSEFELPQVVRVMNLSKGLLKSLCTGTIIGKREVLTASHCVENVLSVSIQSAGLTVSASQILRAPGYFVDDNLQAIFADVAVILTDQDLPFAPIPILVSRDLILGESLQIFGYGTDGGADFGALRRGTMSADNITDGHIFATFDGSQSNTCFGDSGGPAMVDAAPIAPGAAAVVGIVSSGTRSDCARGDTTLFTNIQNSATLSFILQIVPDAVIF